MLVTSGQGSDSRWFDYRAVHFQPVNRVEWPSDTMLAALPVNTANYLVGRNYARRATDAEVEAYTKSVKSEPKAEPEPEPEVEPEPVAVPEVKPEVEQKAATESELQNRRRRKEKSND